MKEDSELEGWQQHFDRSQDPGDLLAALQTSRKRKLPVPDWLYVEIEKILLEKRRERPGRGERSLEERDRQNLVDMMRYTAVEDLLRKGIPYLEVWQAAAEELEGTDFGGLPKPSVDHTRDSLRGSWSN